MEELAIPGIRKKEVVPGNTKTTAAGNLLFTENPAGVERKRLVNQPQFQSALELMGLLEVIWSREGGTMIH